MYIGSIRRASKWSIGPWIEIKTLPVLLVVTFRPEFNPPWMGQSRVMSVTLTRLGERETAAIIARLAGNKELPAEVMAEIVERTDGIPLFVEEMTKAVLEAEDESEARRTVAAVPSPPQAVPASLHASLMARLDRLGPAKDMAQIGAAIGAGIFPCPSGCGGEQAGGRVGIGARPSHRRGFALPSGCAAARDLPVQAWFGARCGLQHAPSRAPTCVARPHRGNLGNTIL